MRVPDCAVYNFGSGNRAVLNVGFLNLACADLGGGNYAILDLRCADGRFPDFGTGNGSVIDLRRANCSLSDLRPDNGSVFNLCGSDGGFPDFGFADGGVLDMRGLNCSHLHLQTAHRSGLQLPAPHRIQRKLRAGNGAAGQLPSGDHTAFQRIRRRAQRNRSVFARQAIVGVLCHAHGYFHTNAPGNHPH